MSINTSSPIPSSKGIQQVPAVVSYDRVQVGAITNVLVSIGSFFDRNPQLKNTPYLQKNYEQIKFVLAAAQSTLQTGVGTPNFAYAFEAMQQIMFWLANDENKYYPQALDFYNNIIIPMQNNVMVFRGENNQKIRMIDEANTGTTGIQYAKLYGTNMFVKAKWLEYTTLQLDVKKLRKAIIERDGTDREKAKLAYGAKIRQVLSNFRNVKNILKAQINSIAPLNGVDQWAKKQKVDLENLVTSYLELMGINIDGEITMSGLKIFLNCTDNEAYQIFLECGYQKGYPRLLLPDEVKKYESGVFAYLSLCKELRTESGLLSGVSSQLATNVENDQSIYLQASQQNNTQVRQYFGQYERTLSSIAASLSVIRTQSGTNYQRALVQIKEKRTQLNEVRKEIQIFSRLLKPGSAELSKGNSNDAYINDLVNRLRHPVAIVGKPDSYEEVGTYEAKNVVDAHLFSINKMIADVDESIENYNRTIQEQTYIKDVQLHMRNMSDIVRTVRREQEDASLIPKAISEARLATNAVNALEAFNLENKRKKHENPDITAYIKEMRLGHLLSSVSNIGCALVESHKYAMCSPVGAEADFQKIYTKLQANLEVIFSSDRADLLPYQKKMIADQMILQLANLYKDNAKYPEARFLFNLIISGKSENLPTDKDIRHIAEAYLNLGCSVTDADTIAQAENATGNIDFQDFDYTPANRHFEEAQNELIHAGVVDASGKFQHIEDLEENPWKVEAYTFLQLDRLRNDLYRKENIDIDQLLGQLTLLENTLKQVITQGKERVQQQAKLMLIETNLRRAELLSLQCKYKDVLSLVDPILQDSSIKGRVKSGFLRIKGFALNGLGEHIEAKDFFKSIYDNTHTLQFNEFKIDAAYGYFSAKLNNKEEINLKEIDVWLPLKLSRPEQNLLIEKSVKPPSLMTIEDTVQLRIIQKCLLLLATIWLDMGDYSSAMTAIDQLDKMKLSPWDKADLNSLRTKIYVAKENIPAAKSSQELSKKNFLSWDDKITQFENATEISLYEEPFSLETTNNKFEAFISEITPHINSNQADRFLNDYVNYLIKTLQYKEAGELQDLMAGKPSPASASSLSKAMGTFIGIHFKDTTTIPKPVQDKLARTRSIIQNAEIPPNIQGKELSDALSAYISTTIDAAKCDPQNSSDKLIIIESRLAHISRLQQAQLRQDAINELLSLIDFVRGDDKKDLTELTHNTKRILFNCYSILVKLYIGGEDFSKASNIVKNQMPIVSVDEKNVFQRRLLLSQIDLKKENEPSELRFKPDDLPLIQQNELKFRELFDLYQSGIVEVSASALKEAFNQLKPIQKMSFQRELESMGPEIRSIYPKSATDATYLDALMTQFSSKELQKLTPVLAQQRILDTLQKMDVASSKNKVSAFEGYKYQLYNALIEIYRTGKPKQQEKNREKLVQLQSLINTDKEIFINYPLYRDQLLQSLGGAVEQLQSTDPKALRKSIASQLTPTLTGMGSTLSQSEANNPRDDRYNLYQPNAPLSGQVESVLLIKESGNFKNTFSGATFYPHINNIRLSANSTQGITTYNVYRLLPTGYPLGSPIYKTTDPNDTQLAYYRGRHHPIEETTTGSTNGVSQPNLYGIPSTLLTNTISGDTKVGPVNLMVEGNGAYSPFINHAGIKIGLGIAAGKTTSFRLTGGQNFIDNKITAYTIPPGTVGYNPDGTSYPIQAGTFLYTDKGTRNYWTASGSTTLLGQQITGTTGIEQRVDDSDIQRTSLGLGPKNLANGGISFLLENTR